jgi:hypothetical protein
MSDPSDRPGIRQVQRNCASEGQPFYAARADDHLEQCNRGGLVEAIAAQFYG